MGNSPLVFHRGRLTTGLSAPPIPSRAMKSFFSAFPDKTNPWKDFSQAHRSAPVVFSLALTQDCGFHCAYCSAASRRPGIPLTTPQWKQVIAEAQEMGTAILQFTGGEPLLHPDLVEIIASADSRSMVNLFTSGQGLTLAKAKLLAKAGLFGISISLDSPDPQIHDGRRGVNGAYKIALEAMKNASQAGLFVASTMVIPDQLPTLESFIAHGKLLKALGVKELMVTKEIACGRGVNRLDGTSDLLPFIHQARKYLKMIITLPDELKGPGGMGCLAGGIYAYVSPTGDLFPCDFLPVTYGHVVQGSLKILWESMRDEIGLPRPFCMADQFRPGAGLSAQELPVDRAVLAAKLAKTTAMDFPGFYRILQGR